MFSVNEPQRMSNVNNKVNQKTSQTTIIKGSYSLADVSLYYSGSQYLVLQSLVVTAVVGCVYITR